MLVTTLLEERTLLLERVWWVDDVDHLPARRRATASWTLLCCLLGHVGRVLGPGRVRAPVGHWNPAMPGGGFAFSAYQLDARSTRLLRHGPPVDLSPRPCALLPALVTSEDIEREKARNEGFGVFIRSLVGLDDRKGYLHRHRWMNWWRS